MSKNKCWEPPIYSFTHLLLHSFFYSPLIVRNKDEMLHLLVS